MAEQLLDAEVEVEVNVVEAPLDSIGKAINEKFQEAKDYRKEFEEEWRDAYDAYKAKYPAELNKATELASERGIYVNLTRRKVNSAKVKISSLLFDDGRIPFSITPSRRPRYMPPDIPQGAGKQDVEDFVAQRAYNMESRIRDIMDRTGYLEEIQSCIHELSLYGTGVSKSPVLQYVNYPVYSSDGGDGTLFQVEAELESELVPSTKFVSIWNVFPSPEATNAKDADFIIQRSYLSRSDLLDLSKEQEGFLPDVIDEILEKNIGAKEGDQDSDHPHRLDEHKAGSVKKFEVLEFWGKLDIEDLEGHIPIPDGAVGYMDVVVHVVGDRVIKLAANPFDGQKPFHFAYWQQNPEMIWGDGIYYAIRDVQALMNFAYAMMIEGKTLSAAPLTIVNPAAMEAGQDTESIYPGKQFKVRSGSSVQDAFGSVIIPDVTNGLGSMIQMLEREADLDSGQVAIGYGEQSPSQTRTATGMSILNSNANKATASVVRSISGMITQNVSSLYHWLMVDSEDTSIKGDFESISTGWTQYVAREIHNEQLIGFLQALGQVPQLQEYIRYETFVQPFVRAFNLDPEKVVMPEEEVQMKRQQNQQSQVQAVQQELQMKQQALDAELNSRSGFERSKAVLDEKKAVSEDIRQSQIAERQILMNKGNVLKEPVPDYYAMSLLLNEEKQRQMQMAQAQQQRQIQAAQQQAAMAQAAEAEKMNRMQQAQLREARAGMADEAQERLQGGPGQRELIDEQREDPDAR